MKKTWQRSRVQFRVATRPDQGMPHRTVTLTEPQYQIVLSALAWIDSHGESEWSETLTARERLAFERVLRRFRALA